MLHRCQALIVGCALVVWPVIGAAQSQRSSGSVHAPLRRCRTTLDCQTAAKAAFDAEMARVGHDCASASNQHDENLCLTGAADSTERNFETFYGALERIVGAEKLGAPERAWLGYRKTQCDAIFDFWRPGTIAPSAQARCRIALTRSRMRDLDDLYETPLHH